jgi:Uma2 family endonuclease
LRAGARSTFRHELVEGLVVAEPRPRFPHGAAQARITIVLGAFVDRHELGQVVCEAGFVLARNPDTVRGPDVAFVSRERLSEASDLSKFPRGRRNSRSRSVHRTIGQARSDLKATRLPS